MKKVILVIILALVLLFGGGTFLKDSGAFNYIEDELGIDLAFLTTEEDKEDNSEQGTQDTEQVNQGGTDLTSYEIPEFTGEEVEVVNNNTPYFEEEDLNLSNGSWETFADYDSFGRVGVADALLHKDLMPTQSREDSGSISHIYPTGFKHNGESNNQRVDGGWLYHRSHLIGFQLTGHMNNEHNLMTGTKTFNTPNMVIFENEVTKYIKETDNHVRYRVTPAFSGEEQLARGIFMEAQSVEDDTIKFNVFIHNVEEGIELDYNTGEVLN